MLSAVKLAVATVIALMCTVLFHTYLDRGHTMTTVLENNANATSCYTFAKPTDDTTRN